jgi:predicted transcriptional regulator of viral defense system
MTIIDEIKKVMEGKESMHLSEIYEKTSLKKSSVRSVLNESIAKGKNFERLGKGNYRIKKEEKDEDRLQV